MRDKHTARLPLYQDDDGGYPNVIYDADHKPVAEIDIQGGTEDEDDHLTRLIVHRVNTYEALREALDSAERVMVVMRAALLNAGGAPMPTVEAVIEQARAALKLAEGEQ